MSLKSTKDATAWSDVHLYMGDSDETTGDMPAAANMVDLGTLDDQDLSITLTDGTVYQLKDINQKLVDELEFEPELEVAGFLQNPDMATLAKFWDVVEDTTVADDVWVKGTITTGKKAVMFSNPKAIGSRAFAAPISKASLQPGYSREKGWVNPVSFKILNTGQKGWFKLPLVKAETEQTNQQSGE